MSLSGETCRATATIEIYNPADVRVGNGCATETATRFEKTADGFRLSSAFSEDSQNFQDVLKDFHN
jgi:hypothetical protein